MHLDNVTEFTVISACLITGTFVYRRLPGSVRLLVIHSLAALIITIIGRITGSRGINNHAYFNIYLPFDFLLMLFAARDLSGAYFRPLAVVGCATFFLTMAVLLYQTGIHQMAYMAISVGAIFHTIAYLMALLRNSRRPVSRYTTAVYFIGGSVLLFYCCTIPVYGMMTYLQYNHQQMAGMLQSMNAIFSFMMYLFTAVGLYLMSTAKRPAHA